MTRPPPSAGQPFLPQYVAFSFKEDRMGGDIRTSTIDDVASSRPSIVSERLPRRWSRQLDQNLRIFPFALILTISLGASVFIGSTASTELDIIALGLLLAGMTSLIVTLAVSEPSIVRQTTTTGSARLVQLDTYLAEIQQREEAVQRMQARRPDYTGDGK